MREPESSCATSDTWVGMEVQARHMVFTGTAGTGWDRYQQLGMNVSSPYMAFSATAPAGWWGASLQPGRGEILHPLGLLTLVGLGPQCVRVNCSLQ